MAGADSSLFLQSEPAFPRRARPRNKAVQGDRSARLRGTSRRAYRGVYRTVDRDDLGVQAGPGSDLVVDPKPADKAAVSSIRVALIALGASAVGVWLAMLFGSILLLVLGLLAWLICWP